MGIKEIILYGNCRTRGLEWWSIGDLSTYDNTTLANMATKRETFRKQKI